MALVFVAVGGDAAGVVTGGEVGVAARAVAPALLVTAMIYGIGDVSGAHFNPVVTAAFALKRLFPPALVPVYWFAQTLGAIGGALLVRALLGDAVKDGVSTPHISSASALGFEVVLTLLLVTVILGTADRHRIVGTEAALAVGATIALCGLVALPLEGASMNPARSLITGKVCGVRVEEVEEPTMREIEVLQLISDGLVNREIGTRLFLSEETVKSHVRHLLAKLQARSRAHAVAVGFRRGLIA